MDINSINNSSIYGATAKVEERKDLKSTEGTTDTYSSKSVDKLEISEEAKLSSLLNYNSIRERIKSGFYENAEVLHEVAVRLSADIPVEETI